MDAPALHTPPRDPGSVDQPGLVTGELPEIHRIDNKTARKRFRLTLKLVAFVAVLYFFVLPLIPGFRSAWTELQKVEPRLLVFGFLLQLAALFSYALLTRAALGAPGQHL